MIIQYDRKCESQIHIIYQSHWHNDINERTF